MLEVVAEAERGGVGATGAVGGDGGRLRAACEVERVVLDGREVGLGHTEQVRDDAQRELVGELGDDVHLASVAELRQQAIGVHLGDRAHSFDGLRGERRHDEPPHPCVLLRLEEQHHLLEQRVEGPTFTAVVEVLGGRGIADCARVLVEVERVGKASHEPHAAHGGVLGAMDRRDRAEPVVQRVERAAPLRVEDAGDDLLGVVEELDVGWCRVPFRRGAGVNESTMPGSLVVTSAAQPRGEIDEVVGR